VKAARFDYVKAASCAEAVRLLAQSGGTGKVVAGWQSLGPLLNLRLARPEVLVDVTGVPELSLVADEGSALVMGACIRHAAIEDGKVPDVTRGLMPFVARGIAYRAVRNRGTLGGSLAHADPAADWVSLMALLDAQYLLIGSAGTRIVGSADWMQRPFVTALAADEILAGIRIPALSPSARWSYYKFNRKAGKSAQAIAAFLDDPARGVRRCVIGATAGAPWVVADATALIDKWHPDAAGAALVAAGLAPGSYEYRIHAAALQRAAAELRSADRRAA
jgi:carbon-monoxide dehydrogenase medium subunit